MSWSEFRKLADEPNFALLTTLMPGGQPQSHVMWVDTDPDTIVVNTEVHRQKYRNIVRDPRVTVVVIDRNNPYRYVEARGEVSGIVTGDPARAHIDQLSMKYRGEKYSAQIISSRVLLHIRPTVVVLGNRG
jgi:PPOX class probable F420-dependent enzyme